jgi:hypothetical protein
MKASHRVVEWTLIVAAATALLPAALAAQGRGHGGGHGHVPPGHMPPPGTCRVWYDGLPPGHQPAPTSCGAARARAYHTGGRVIYGAVEYRDRDWQRHHSRDRDRYCDEWDSRRGECGYYRVDRYPRRRDGSILLPEMVWGVIFGRGRVVVEVQPWVAVSHASVSVVDRDRDGRPEMVIWYDARSRVVQRWFDDDCDGRADRVAFYDGARVVRVVR